MREAFRVHDLPPIAAIQAGKKLAQSADQPDTLSPLSRVNSPNGLQSKFKHSNELCLRVRDFQANLKHSSLIACFDTAALIVLREWSAAYYQRYQCWHLGQQNIEQIIVVDIAGAYGRNGKWRIIKNNIT